MPPATKKTARSSKSSSKSSSKAAAAPANRVAVGDASPVFELRDQNDQTHTIGGTMDRAVVLFFYPKDLTSGCTTQACGFRDLQTEFETAGAGVFGISILGTKSKRKFADKESLEFPLLADDRVNAEGKPDPEVAQRFGVWVEKSMYGRTYMGLERVTFLIDRQGVVRERWDKVKVPGHVDGVLEAVRAL